MFDDVIDGLRQWARGDYGTEAAVELLVRADGGRWGAPARPWIRLSDDGDGRWWVDWDALATEGAGGPFSGGERRYLAIAASIGDGHPVDLRDATSLDRPLLALVLAAIAHAGGSHQHPIMRPRVITTRNGRTLEMDWPTSELAGPLVAWPEADVGAGQG
ncbi:hypothetical protein [Georgenia yuyongxinii]|uniref:Uncharacterized protein n=1 Tax=Georgenia yuyongxinii TaxID=2589797 RepID=A0A552WNW2_9MICO|nr:hypothetical protein [Georgenia yuyongxinii]TRW44387.1 hypothetical protein FJ693_13740 [Georgenia yuyongxinii]